MNAYDTTNAYGVLGVSDAADVDEVKQAYRRLARRYHPDHGGNADDFQRVRQAYEIVLRKLELVQSWASFTPLKPAGSTYTPPRQVATPRLLLRVPRQPAEPLTATTAPLKKRLAHRDVYTLLWGAGGGLLIMLLLGQAWAYMGLFPLPH